MNLKRNSIMSESHKINNDINANININNLKKSMESIEEKEEHELAPFSSEIMDIKNHISSNHSDLLQQGITNENVKEELKIIIDTLVIDHFKKHKLSPLRKDQIILHIMQQLSEFGPITDIYNTPGVTDVHVKSYNNITYRKDGVLYSSAVTFTNEAEVSELIERLLRNSSDQNQNQSNTKKTSYLNPIENSKLADGSRVNIMIDPISLKGPTISIRKHRDGFFSKEQHLQMGTFTQEMVHYLQRCCEARVNTLIIGGGGTGKTEILRLCGTFIPKNLNVDTLEDTEELKLDKFNPMVRPFEFRKDLVNRMKGSAYDILRWGSLRSDIDIVILGEILENEAFPVLLESMSIGQPGSMASLHSDTARSALIRGVKMYAAVYPNLTDTFIMNDIANTIDQIITVKRFKDGKRKISKITQVNGVENNEFLLQDVYKYSLDQGHYRTEHNINERIIEKFEDNEVEQDISLKGIS